MHGIYNYRFIVNIHNNLALQKEEERKLHC